MPGVHDQPLRPFAASLLVAVAALMLGCQRGSAERAPGHTPAAALHAPVVRIWRVQAKSAMGEDLGRDLRLALHGLHRLPGNLGYQLMRGAAGEDIHYLVLTYWDAEERVHAVPQPDLRGTRRTHAAVQQELAFPALQIVAEEVRLPGWAAWRPRRCVPVHGTLGDPWNEPGAQEKAP